MIETKDYLRELGSYLFVGVLVGALYGGNVYCGSLAGKKRIAEAATLQSEEKMKNKFAGVAKIQAEESRKQELEACVQEYRPRERIITLDDLYYNKECYLKFLDTIEKR